MTAKQSLFSFFSPADWEGTALDDAPGDVPCFPSVQTTVGSTTTQVSEVEAWSHLDQTVPMKIISLGSAPCTSEVSDLSTRGTHQFPATQVQLGTTLLESQRSNDETGSSIVSSTSASREDSRSLDPVKDEAGSAHVHQQGPTSVFQSPSSVHNIASVGHVRTGDTKAGQATVGYPSKGEGRAVYPSSRNASVGYHRAVHTTSGDVNVNARCSSTGYHSAGHARAGYANVGYSSTSSGNASIPHPSSGFARAGHPSAGEPNGGYPRAGSANTGQNPRQTNPTRNPQAQNAWSLVPDPSNQLDEAVSIRSLGQAVRH